MRPRAILFDLFGTLVAYRQKEEGNRASWRAIYRELRELGIDVAYKAFVQTWAGQFAQPLSEASDGAGTVFERKLGRLFGTYGVPWSWDDAQRTARACLQAWSDYVVIPPDTLPALEALSSRYRLGLVSNFDHPPYVHDLLARSGLASYFDPIVSGEVGIDKPDARIFHLGCRAVESQPRETLFVGDDLEADIAGARGAGCRPVLIDRANQYTEYTDLRITTLAQLPDALYDLEALPR
jgi:putative hydrolase of the HAD superfamily